MCKILVTGGAGFIGSNLCEALLVRKGWINERKLGDDLVRPVLKNQPGQYLMKVIEELQRN